MKALLLAMFVSASVLSLSSCSSSKVYKRDVIVTAEIPTEETSCFIKFKDGTLKNYKSLKLVTGFQTKPHLLADGKERIYGENVEAYSNGATYALYSGRFSIGGQKSSVAKDVLPGFAVRIFTGKLNVFEKRYMKNGVLATEYYFQQHNGQILPYSAELLESLIKNMPEALSFYNTYRKHIKVTPELKATAYVYNNTYFATVSKKK